MLTIVIKMRTKRVFEFKILFAPVRYKLGVCYPTLVDDTVLKLNN